MQDLAILDDVVYDVVLLMLENAHHAVFDVLAPEDRIAEHVRRCAVHEHRKADAATNIILAVLRILEIQERRSLLGVKVAVVGLLHLLLPHLHDLVCLLFRWLLNQLRRHIAVLVHVAIEGLLDEIPVDRIGG